MPRVYSAAMPEVIVSAAALAEELASPRPPRLLDVRWQLGGPPGIDGYRAGHLPGAVYVDLETELASHATPAEGRHPLPDPEVLQRAARRWGLRQDDQVVVYDDYDSMSAARAWWTLRWAGFDRVRILDGGLAGWVAAGGELDQAEVHPPLGDVVLSSGHLPALDADGAAEWAEQGLLLDARAPERFRGEVEPWDPRAGHIPGAVNAPTGQNLGADGTFLPPDALTARFAALGAPAGGQVAVYCGSGVSAAHQAAALTMAGYTPVLYPGSWSQWSSDPERPVATGD
ncbi:sulfurtransferase [Cellulomonas denverensis]|nr:sulfurtransferase [Cellulomonas denverensis]